MQRTLLLVVAAALIGGPAQAQDRGNLDPVIRLTTTKPVRTVYRVAVDVLRGSGYRIAIMFLDNELRTAPLLADNTPARTFVRIVFEQKRDSTVYHVMAAVPDSARRTACHTQECLAQVLAVEGMVASTMEKALNSLPSRGTTLGDSLAAANAYGYTPATAIRVRGPGDPNARDEHAYLNSLRSPTGEPVSWLRLGSCCDFSTPNVLDGRAGRLDAYEVTYPGLAAPVTLYLNMYDPPNRPDAPVGFTRVVPGPPST